MIKIWAAHCVGQSGDPGTVLRVSAEGIVVACGRGGLSLTSLQRAGGNRVDVSDFLRGNAVGIGDRLGDLPR